eukprot:862211-Amphidinium_carterae.1
MSAQEMQTAQAKRLNRVFDVTIDYLDVESSWGSLLESLLFHLQDDRNTSKGCVISANSKLNYTIDADGYSSTHHTPFEKSGFSEFLNGLSTGLPGAKHTWPRERLTPHS